MQGVADIATGSMQASWTAAVQCFHRWHLNLTDCHWTTNKVAD